LAETLVRPKAVEISERELDENALQVTFGFDLRRQKSRNPARCHLSTVSGFTDPSGKEHQQASLVGQECRLFHLAGCDDQLPAKQGVLGDELPASPQDIARQTGDHWQRVDETPQGLGHRD
jgi:hypothetical protein